MIDFDLDNASGEDVERFHKTGGILPAGKYHCRLDGAKDAQTQTTTGVELHYVVASGPFAGEEIKDSIWNSDKAAAKNRATLFGHRLGLLKRKGAGFEFAPGKSDFADCIGAEVVLEVKHEPYVSKTTGKNGIGVRVTFNGIWSTDDPAVKSVVKSSGPSTSPGKQGETPAKQTGRVDTSKL